MPYHIKGNFQVCVKNLHQVVFKSNLYEACRAVYTKFAHNIFSVHTDRLIADKQLTRNFFVTECLPDVLHDLDFPAGKTEFAGKLLVGQPVVPVLCNGMHVIERDTFSQVSVSFDDLLDGLQQFCL
jgi:hypothetical protein